MENIVETLKEKQRQRMQTKKMETEKLRTRISFTFDGIQRGYKSTDWRVK